MTLYVESVYNLEEVNQRKILLQELKIVYQ